METMRILRKTIILALCLALCGIMIPAAGENRRKKPDQFPGRSRDFCADIPG